MEHIKLVDIRKAKGFTQEQMAKRIAMEQTTYSRKERGKSPISDNEWERFAKVLDVAIEDIKDNDPKESVKNDNCTFNDNAINTQFINIPQNVFDIIIKYNAKLEEENERLKKAVEGL
jgi:transcriptional regulator with XRE-family HTH domain